MGKLTKSFPKNDRGGWVVPPNTTLLDRITVPAYSVIGKSSIIGENSTLGNGVFFHSGCVVRDNCTIGAYFYCKMKVVFGDNCVLGEEGIISGLSAIGRHCQLGKKISGLGKRNTFGEGTTFWVDSTLVTVTPPTQ